MSGTSGANLFNRAFLLFVLLAGCSLAAADRVVFVIFARVQFSVPADWTVIASKSDADKTVFAFQIPNPAEKGTPDSTNVAIVATDLKDKIAKTAFDKKASSKDQRAQKKKLANNWTCSAFSDMQGATAYAIWDCFRTVAECGVYVRMAWPHLPTNPPEYDKSMETALADILKSIAASPK